MADIGPFDLLAYDDQEQTLREQLGQALARLQYERDTLGITNQRNMDRIGQDWNKAFQRIPGHFAARGLYRSGLRQGAIQDWAQGWQRAVGDLQFGYAGQVGALDLQRSQYEQTLASGLGRINNAKQVRRAQLASQIQAVQ